MTGRDQAYYGWQHERVNFLLGMSGRRTALVALAVLLAVQPISAARLSDALVAWPVAAILALLAYLRVGGRTVDEWMVIAVSFQLLKIRGQNRFHSGAFAPTATGDPAGPAPMDLPGVLAPIRILAAENGTGGTMAVLYHPHDRTLHRCRADHLRWHRAGRRGPARGPGGRLGTVPGRAVHGRPAHRQGSGHPAQPARRRGRTAQLA